MTVLSWTLTEVAWLFWQELRRAIGYQRANRSSKPAKNSVMPWKNDCEKSASNADGYGGVTPACANAQPSSTNATPIVRVSRNFFIPVLPWTGFFSFHEQTHITGS